MKTLRNAAIVLGCLMIAVFAAPQFTNPSNPNYGTNKTGMCYNSTLNNWVGITNTTANLTNYPIQCDEQGNLVLPSGGTVTAIGVTTANGVSGSSSGGATPHLTITLGAITPSSTNGVSAATMAFMDATSSVQTQLNAKQATGAYTTAGTVTINQAACIKATGPPVVIGFCSTVVGADGSCTCN